MSTTFEHGDRVTVLSNGLAYKGQIRQHLGEGIYLVTMKSGAIWRADCIWLKPRTVRNPASF